MEEFGDFNTNDFEFEDPAADFLAREKAILGDDLNFVSPSNDMPQSNKSLDDLMSPTNVPLPVSENNYKPESYNNFSSPQNQNLNQGDLFSPPVSINSQPLGTPNNYTGVTSPDRYSTLSQAASSSYQNLEVESDFVRNWRSQFQDRLGDRDRREQEKHQSVKDDAQRQLTNFYKEYQTKTQNKINQSGRIFTNKDDVNYGKSGWDLVATILSDNNKSNVNVKDVSRLKNLIHDLHSKGHIPKVST